MFTVRCAACGEDVAWVFDLEGLDELALAHDAECAASEERKRQAAVDLELKNLTEGPA
jgi:hypothetical protein